LIALILDEVSDSQSRPLRLRWCFIVFSAIHNNRLANSAEFALPWAGIGEFALMRTLPEVKASVCPTVFLSVFTTTDRQV
jgi:hypothetical protein